jgi:hypothetical protein
MARYKIGRNSGKNESKRRHICALGSLRGGGGGAFIVSAASSSSISITKARFIMNGTRE